MTKYSRAALNKKTPLRVFQQFGGQARSIDIFWSLQDQTPAALGESKNAFKQPAIKAEKKL